MRYKGNPKHKEPWQRGRKGSLCPKEIAPSLAQHLLDTSQLHDGQRYAVHEGKAYCAKEHSPGEWHGHPVGWKEVPASLWLQWQQEDRLKRSDIARYWN